MKNYLIYNKQIKTRLKLKGVSRGFEETPYEKKC